jgi:hypothetical protein
LVEQVLVSGSAAFVGSFIVGYVKHLGSVASRTKSELPLLGALMRLAVLSPLASDSILSEENSTRSTATLATHVPVEERWPRKVRHLDLE